MPTSARGKNVSIFDYTITVTRKNRYLIVSCPEFGFKIASEPLGLDGLSPLAIGSSVLGAFEKIRARLHELDLRRESPPLPLSRRRISRLNRDELLSSREAARALGVSGKTLRKMVKQGLLRVHRTPGGHLRFSLDSLGDYLAA
jgi:excisionase family DNA binding protein